MSKIDIYPDTKLGKLLEIYPQLEVELLSISPTYSKLKNPILRKTVGKVATLRQVAQVGNIPMGDLINRLRKKAGIAEEFVGESTKNEKSGKPAWFKSEAIVKSLDARPLIDSGGHPMEQVMKELAEIEQGKIYELITPFLPAPLLDLVRNKGYQTWTEKTNETIFKSYFCKV